VSLIAAGVAFYGFLAMVPLLGSIVLSYGLVADPATVMENMRSLTSVMPAEAAKLIGEQLLNVVTTSGSKKGFGLLLALALALYGAMKGAGAVITALNIAYEEKETRGFVRLNLVTLAITAGAVVVAIAAIVAVAALGHLDTLFPGAPAFVLTLGKLASYLVLGAAGAAAAATLYRYAPDRDAARWIWLTPGSLAVTLLWLALTIGFGVYVANFGSYDATYGSLGAVVVLLTWLYLSAYVLIMGAELNAELEHQTTADSTAGAPQAMGTRGAQAADTVAGAAKPRPEVIEKGDKRPTGTSADARPSLAHDLAVGRAAARAAGAAGLPKPGLAPVLLATAGLALVRRRGGLAVGTSVIGTATLLAWMQREKAAKSRE
ncbi:MAG TPA: YihY/virulence factor BrkB family protein, partial [Sphingomicrobium sp.]